MGLLPSLLAGVAALMAAAPAPSGHAVAPAPPGLVIAVSDGVSRASVGDRLAYKISLRNDGRTASGSLGVRFTPPVGTKLAKAADGGTVKDGSAAWTVKVGATGTVTVGAEVTVDALPYGANGLAGVACVMAGDVPRLCATDINQIPGRGNVHGGGIVDGPSRWAGAAAITGTALVVGCLVGAGLILRRRRRATAA